MSAMIALEKAIRTGSWAIPHRASDRGQKELKRADPRKFYFVFDPVGERLGYISHSQQRPALEFGGPTYYLKRSHCECSNQQSANSKQAPVPKHHY